MGGEKSTSTRNRAGEEGSPPRGRGKVIGKSGMKTVARITPAWAGKSQSPMPRRTAAWDHPRVGGEKIWPVVSTRTSSGSPPRGRGKVIDECPFRFSDGITPAQAGKSPFPTDLLATCWDHPRMGGEKTAQKSFGSQVIGSPPRGRGKMHLSLTLAYDTLHALTQFFNRVAFVDKLQNRSE